MKELRSYTKMSQAKFAAYLGIPVANIQHWEQNVSTPPNYLVSLISRVMAYDGYIKEMMTPAQIDAIRQVQANLAIENMKVAESDRDIFYDVAKGKISPAEARKHILERYMENE